MSKVLRFARLGARVPEGQGRRPAVPPGWLVLVSMVSLWFADRASLAQPSLAEALDATNLVWTTGGYPVWAGETVYTHDGVDAAGTLPPPYHGESWVETTAVGPGTLSFWTRTGSGSHYLEFYIGDVRSYLAVLSGWTRWEGEIPAGKQVLRWRYYMFHQSPGPSMYLDEVCYGEASGPTTIRRDPENQTLPAGSTANVVVDAWGSPPLSFQWSFNGTMMPHATNYFLTLTNLQLNQTGRYRVVVSNALGMAKSTNAILTVLPCVITEQPRNERVAVGRSATLSIQASSVATLRYQWRFNGGLISGATSAGLTLTDVQEDDAGVYQVELSNSFGLVTSSNAVLTVVPAIDLALAGIWQGGTNRPVQSLVVQPPYAYLACRQGGLQILDVSRPAKPVLVGGCETFGDAFGVDLAGHYAYVSMFDGVLDIIDVSTPTNPVSVVGHYTSGYQANVRVVGDQALLASSGGLYVIDVGDPARPIGLSNYRGSSYDFFRGLDAQLPWAYVARQRAGLVILDISNPSSPKKVGQFQRSAYENLMDVQVLPPTAYLARATSGLDLLDIRDPTAPKLLGSYNTDGSVQGVHVAGRYAFLADGTKGLKVIDAADPATLAHVGDYDTLGEALAVRVAGHHAFVADGSAGLTILRVSRGPEKPPRIFIQPASHTVTAGAAVSFAVTAFGVLPLSYQWEFNGARIPGATRYWHTVSNLQSLQAGAYSVVVSNAYGCARSDPASLCLLTSPAILAGHTNAPALDTQDQFAFTFTTQTNVAYTIQTTDSLPATNWSALRVVVGDGETLRVADAVPADSNRFYRVRASPNPPESR